MGEDVGLVTAVDLLNTLDQRTFLRLGTVHQAEDRLTTVEALEGWFGEHDLATTASPTDLDAARALRDGLRDALLGGRAVGDTLARFPLRLGQADGDGLRLAADTGSAGLDAVVETVATTVADGRWKRLKLCASEDCRWAYLDTSRSGGGRWCSMETCGNRHKTRAYRQRRSA